MDSTPNLKEDHIIIGLDFGTSYSGIAWAITPQLTVHPITDWPGLEGKTQPKVRTTISYKPGENQIFAWGSQKSTWPLIEGVKLLLDPSQETPFYMPDAKYDQQKLAAVGKSAMEVAADYISAIYKHALSKIETKVPIDYYNGCKKKFVISVPAVWSDKARQLTEKAAEKAGISPVQVIKEPEAAALYTLHVNGHTLSKDDAFVVCDAGGGTVDLISYEVKEVDPRLALGELVPSKGGMAGSLGLNKRFEEAVHDLVGDTQYTLLRETRGFEKAVQQFDRDIKTAFRGDDDEDYFVNFPLTKLEDCAEKGLCDKTWHMKSADVKKIFDPLIQNILELIREQVDTVKLKRLLAGHPKRDEIRAIYLVGGFGTSEYLRLRVQQAYPGIQVIQPVEAWSAIVSGAVLSQIPEKAMVTSYVAQKHYGVIYHIKYDEAIDGGQEKWWSGFHGSHRANRMEWYIKRNDDLGRDKKIRFPFFRTLPSQFKTSDLIFTHFLTESDAPQPPVHPGADRTRTNVTLTADLTELQKRDMRKRRGADGKTYHEVNFELTMTVGPALFKFALEIDGKEMGSVDAVYD